MNLTKKFYELGKNILDGIAVWNERKSLTLANEGDPRYVGFQNRAMYFESKKNQIEFKLKGYSLRIE